MLHFRSPSLHFLIENSQEPITPVDHPPPHHVQAIFTQLRFLAFEPENVT